MRKILLIDDDRDLSEVIQHVLALKGYEVLVCHDSQTGLKAAREQKPDLILMDVMLPGMSGAQAVKMLKSDSDLRKIPVVFLTGLVSHNEKDLEREGLMVDGAHYPTLAKPFSNDRLVELVEAGLNRGSRQSSSY